MGRYKKMQPPCPHLDKGSCRANEHNLFYSLRQMNSNVNSKKASIGISYHMSAFNFQAVEEIINPFCEFLIVCDRTCRNTFIHLTNYVYRVSAVISAEWFDISRPYSHATTTWV